MDRSKRQKKAISIPTCILSTLMVILFVSATCQPFRDTLFVTKRGDYDVYRHLYIYKTTLGLTPKFILDSTKERDFTLLYPDKTFNNTGGKRSEYWLVLTLKNNMLQEQSFQLWLNSPDIFTARIYQINSSNKIKLATTSGYPEKGSKRQNYNNDVDFHFVLPRLESVIILINLKNDYGSEAYFYPQLADQETYESIKLKNSITLSIIVGLMMISLLLNIFNGFFLRERIHYLYAIYVTCMLFEVLELEGISTIYIDQFGSPRLTDVISHVMPIFCVILMTTVMKWYMKLTNENSKLKRYVDLINILLALTSFLYVIELFVDYIKVFQTVLLINLCICITAQAFLVTACAIERILQGYIPAWLYLVATLMFLIGTVEYALAYSGYNDILLIQGSTPNLIQVGFVLETVVVLIAIVYRSSVQKKHNAKLETEKKEQREMYIEKMIQTEADERKRIAQDLHDDVGATLNALVLHLSNNPLNSEQEKQYYQRSHSLALKAANDVRLIAHNLLPDNFSAQVLFELLNEKIADFENSKIAPIHFELITLGDCNRLNEKVAMHIYRIVNELLQNVIRHSLASIATIQVLIFQEMIQVISEDDGRGFDPDLPVKGIGLKSIKSRVEFLGGSMIVDSGSNGTCVIIEIPF